MSYKHNLDEEKIIEMYQSGKTLKEIGSAFNVSYGTIRLRLQRNNVPIRTKSEVKRLEFKDFLPDRHGRKYNLDYKYFQTWSNNMAYILGFLSADGYVAENKYLKITLQEQDIEILNHINKEFKSTYKVRKLFSRCGEKYYSSCELLIYSKHMVEDLIRLGVTQGKSLTVNLDSVPCKYRLDFIRGYFDGDGSVGEQWSKRGKTPMLRVRIFSGSEKMLYQIVQEFYKNGVPKVNVRKSKNKTLYSIEYSQRASKEIYKLFYKSNPKIYLKRKRDKFEDILSKQNI